MANIIKLTENNITNYYVVENMPEDIKTSFALKNNFLIRRWIIHNRHKFVLTMFNEALNQHWKIFEFNMFF
jgi:hypothetical protein